VKGAGRVGGSINGSMESSTTTLAAEGFSTMKKRKKVRTHEPKIESASREPLNPKSTIALDLSLFAGTFLAAWYFDWKTYDLVWGLWSSSLIVGYALIVTGIIANIVLAKSVTEESFFWRLASWMGRLFSAAFLLAFFSVHFGFFHIGHAAFLNALFPNPAIADRFANGPSLEGLRSSARALLGDNWLFILASVISAHSALGKAIHQFEPMASYVNVVRMHLLIFFFVFASALKLENRFLYAVVLLVYFFPFKAFGQLLRPLDR